MVIQPGEREVGKTRLGRGKSIGGTYDLAHAVSVGWLPPMQPPTGTRLVWA